MRPASEADAGFLAEVILMASRSPTGVGIWDLLGYESEVDRLALVEYVVLGPATSVCHFTWFTVAEHAGHPAAALAAFDPRHPGLLPLGVSLAATLEELGMPAPEVSAALGRLAPFQAVSPDPAPAVWTIEWVGAMPAFRRIGLVSGLVEEALAAGRAHGATSAQVTTFLDNGPARKLYERLGFAEASRRESDSFRALTGSRGLVRFVRRL